VVYPAFLPGRMIADPNLDAMRLLRALAIVTLSACQSEINTEPVGGVLRVVVRTSGATLDSDGYTYRVGSSTVTLAAQDTQDLRDLPVGRVPVELGGLAANCRAPSPGPDSVDTRRMDTVSLVVSCDSALRNIILFERWTEAGRPEVWMMRPDGTGKTLFLAEASDPAPTPNGTQVVYADRTTGRLGIMRADETRHWALVPGVPGGQFGPDVSPDGRSVVFAATTGGPARLYRADLDGTGILELTPAGPGPDTEARWSPDGRFITFTRVGTDIQLYRIPAEGGDTVPLTAAGGGCCARWSPGGDRLLFFNPAGGGLWTMSPDGSNAVPVDAAPYNAVYAEWSPDGTQIVIERVVEGLSQIWRVPLEGGGPVTIADEGQNQLGRWLR
jgi:hypothetical protein